MWRGSWGILGLERVTKPDGSGGCLHPEPPLPPARGAWAGVAGMLVTDGCSPFKCHEGHRVEALSGSGCKCCRRC